ncbi:Metallopeptidase, catalytic domain protein [Akanthomyces lecanii RCEF 1005]|uniref:Metallopeptidase, catalytic domain protein n=1 Tax=Akanthomyces lecanii RCEF 1005 TaxID=1081108 RepID=A0A168L1J4_CORDF|nr:Metallopeptidase, catalytic domain protein [Akanthomyces lecanii RCEF 1005]
MASQIRLTVPSTTKQKLEVINLAGGKVPATLTEADLRKDLPQKASDAPSDGEPSYTCVTERNPPRSSPAAIMVGLWEEIPRWKNGSVINFATYADGYPAPGDAIYAANCLIEAAEIWNSARVGVTFKWVPNVDDAAFVLGYGGQLGTVLASAFFPSNSDLEHMSVYQHGFDKTERTSKKGKYSNYGIMKNVFLHELGHVLGLRHEFAMKPDTYEGGAIVLGSANIESVMSYVFPPELQESDIQDTRDFYKHPLIVDYTPDN